MTHDAVARWSLPIVAAVGAALLATAARADPPIIPDPPPVFCFAKTGADQINGGEGIRIQFEILNWTPENAHGLQITAANDPAISTGVNTAGANEMFGAPTPAPLFGGFVGKANTNDWSVAASSATQVAWAAGTPLPSLDPFAAPLPSPLDSGINTLDGFILDLPWLGVFERVVFGWSLLDQFGVEIDDPNGFSFGLFQIDRALNGPNGEVRQSSFVTANARISDITSPPPLLDPNLTNTNATTDSAVGANVVPLPPTLWLMAAAILGGLGFGRRGRRGRAAA